MAHKKRKSPLKGRKHTKRSGVVRRHKRMVAGVNPSVVSGTRRRAKRKRKVSGVTGNEFLDALLGLGFGVVVGVVYDKVAPIENEKIKKGLETALGAATAYFGAQKKNMFMLGIGLGVAGDGAKGVAKEFGIIQGMESFMSGLGITAPNEDAMLIEMNGIEQQKMMGDTRGGAEGVMGDAMPSVIS